MMIIKHFFFSIKSFVNGTNDEEPQTPNSKKQIPGEIQKQMLDFFMQTSIPRKKTRTTELQEKQKIQKIEIKEWDSD
jgi:hypothetical protein